MYPFSMNKGGICMSTPGIADPYWFEWYVGLKNIIDMINPDSGIESVVFQHETYNTIDDVVVEYQEGNKQICYQVKHEIATSNSKNLTFGNLLEKKNKKSLFSTLFTGWKEAVSHTNANINPILFTNRKISNRHIKRTYKDKTYSAYPVDEFLKLLKEEFLKADDYSNFSIEDDNLLYQWKELYDDLDESDICDIGNFIKKFTIRANQSDLAVAKDELITALAVAFSCKKSIAMELFSKLQGALSDWTTTLRKNEKITIEDVYSVLGTEQDIYENQHRLTPPFPFFESRKEFCKELELKIKSTDKKVVFISGNPGSGKTSTISYLQSSTNMFFLRYHIFRPISPEQNFYNTDEGMYSSENLWGTLLIQLRHKFKGELAKYNVPISNKLLTVEMMRKHVIRLLGILGHKAITNRERIYVCIDGIDHAARAKNNISFLPSLLLPEEIPDGVCFVIVGQPSTMYQTQYPYWLVSGDNVDHLEMPKLCICDIEQLIQECVPNLNNDIKGLAAFIYQCTEGNNLSSIFAIEEIKSANSLDECIARLKDCGISSNVEQYYSHIWDYMKREIVNMGIGIVFPESIVACPILLMNGRVNTRILSRALSYELSETDWKLILDRLYPLVVPCSEDGEYSIFHNDFRVFLMSVVKGYNLRYEEIALALAEDLLKNDEGLLTYVFAIPLLQCANKTDLIPKYFTAGFVINALAEGVSKQRLDEYAHISYEATCINNDIDGYINIYTALNTLYQHEAYFEYFDRTYLSNDYPEINTIDISEIRVLPVKVENLSEYKNVLNLCTKLVLSGTDENVGRAHALYDKWFGNLTPVSFALLSDNDETDLRLRKSGIDELLQSWGRTAALLKVIMEETGEVSTDIEMRANWIFGEAYFDICLKQENIDCVVEMIHNGYVLKSVFAEKLEEIFYKGLTKEFKEFLFKFKTKEITSEYFLTKAMLVTIEEDISFDKALIEPAGTINHIYDDSSFTVILRAFLLGYIERFQDDAVICSHVTSFCSELEDDETKTNQTLCLSKLACLVGKYYWDYDGINSEPFARYIKWFLTTKLRRSFDYSKACKFLLFALLKSNVSKSLVSTDWFIIDLKTYLFKIENLGMYYKTYILEFLKNNNRLDIIREYILELYGENCSKISIKEDKIDIHKTFCPYGKLVEPQMMSKFTAQLKWDVVGYVGHKEYAMMGLLDCFESISVSQPSLWSDCGHRLYRQSVIAELSNNRCAFDICKSIIRSAVNCGFMDYWKLHLWSDEFKNDPEFVYQSIFEFVNRTKTIDELKILWILNCGIHSWYTQEDRSGSKCVFNACCKKSEEFGVDFKIVVESTTPQWLPIVNCNNSIKELEERDDYFKHKTEEIENIRKEYYSINIEELMSYLPNIYMLSCPTDRYIIIIERLKSENIFTIEKARAILDSVCIYLKQKQWRWEYVDSIIVPLLSNLGEEAFWALAYTIGEYLSEYNYQTSTRNMHTLLKLYYDHNISNMKKLFDRELIAQQLWVSGNNHIDVDFRLDSLQSKFDIPNSLDEMVLYILLEQVESQNTRKIEAAILGIYTLGKHFNDIIKIVADKWCVFSVIQKEVLFPIIVRWIYDDLEMNELHSVLHKAYNNCNALSEKYYLHSILLLLKTNRVEVNKICYDAESCEYVLPTIGFTNDSSSYENFLSLIDDYEVNSDTADSIRRYIDQFSIKDKYIKDKYSKAEDTRIPVFNQDIDRILYGEERIGHFNSTPLISKKSRLVSPEDPFILTEMPQIVYGWFPNLDTHNNKSQVKSLLSDFNFNELVRKEIKQGETLLSSCLWYPWGYKDGVVYGEVSKIESINNSFRNNRFDWCLGNVGLLYKEGMIDETISTTLYNGGLSLFNCIGGSIRINYGNSQFNPSSVWRDVFKCKPSDSSPYVWLDENNNEVLHFERIASPFREGVREAYMRQPILFRWICNSEWLEEKLKELKLRIWFINSIEKMPLQIS